MKFLKHKPVLYKKSGLKMSKEIVSNIKKAIKELNLGTEITVISIDTAIGREMVSEEDIPEVPCLVLGKHYYFRDSLLSYNKLKAVLKKWSK